VLRSSSGPKMERESAHIEVPTSKSLFLDRNPDARRPSIPRDLAPLLLRLARVRLNVGSGSAGPAHLADHIGAVA
jgi:hypothetical protein